MLAPLIEQEKSFNILQNEAGELMILIRARLEDASNPKLVYNGGEHALLYRNDHNTVILDYIHPAIRKALRQKKKVLIVETNNGAIVREYVCDVAYLKNMSVPKNLVTI
ncbi:MAG: hypothetical protein II942_04525 [Alphaproteobacteria bacterium]|nr:hypothetical protein [Alphaproteobacteria bacterium]